MKEKHKLSPPWEGPYMVTEVIRPGTYRLEDDNGNVLTNTWNIEQLRHFSLNLVLSLFSQTLAPVKHPSLNTFSPGRSGLHEDTILNITSLFTITW